MTQLAVDGIRNNLRSRLRPGPELGGLAEAVDSLSMFRAQLDDYDLPFARLVLEDERNDLDNRMAMLEREQRELAAQRDKLLGEAVLLGLAGAVVGPKAEGTSKQDRKVAPPR